MSDKIPEMSKTAAVQALASINESIANLKHNRQVLLNTLGMTRGDDVDDIVTTIQSEVEQMCSEIPSDLPKDDACEWLKHALLDVIYNNT